MAAAITGRPSSLVAAAITRCLLLVVGLGGSEAYIASAPCDSARASHARRSGSLVAWITPWQVVLPAQVRVCAVHQAPVRREPGCFVRFTDSRDLWRRNYGFIHSARRTARSASRGLYELGRKAVPVLQTRGRVPSVDKQSPRGATSAAHTHFTTDRGPDNWNMPSRCMIRAGPQPRFRAAVGRVKYEARSPS